MGTDEHTLHSLTIPAGRKFVHSSKVSLPKQGGLICQRDRLVRQTSELLGQGHLWISGPPGAGKTVLAAGMADRSPVPVAWYGLDPLDADPALFFTTFPHAFTGFAGKAGGASGLTTLRPEDMLGMSVFARKFFRQLFSLLPEKWMLIIDDVHELPEDSLLLEILAIGLQEAPEGCRVILLSRRPPPPAFARLQINGLLHTADPDILRFTQSELIEVMALHGIKDRDGRCLRHLSRITAGWAAGVTLLLKKCCSEFSSGFPETSGNYEELFNYFVGVIFSRLREDEKKILMTAALLPEIRPALLSRLTGGNSIRDYFLRLSRDNFFIYRLDNRGELFQLHPMFKTFLQSRAGEEIQDNVRRKLLVSAAEFYIAEDRPVDGIDLFLAADNPESGIRIIKKIGTTLLEQGRFRTLLRWQQALPEQIVRRDPWLLFFFGNATIAYDPVRAIDILEQSFSLFQEHENASGALLACSSLTNSVINYLSDLSILDPWLDYLNEQLDPSLFPEDGCFENIALANAVFRALVLRRPDDPDIEAWQQVVVRLGGLHPALITHYLWTGRLVEARAALDWIYANREKVGSKLQFSAIQAMEVQYFLIMGRLDDCLAAIENSLQLIEETGIRVWEVHFLILGAGCCLSCGASDKAEEFLRKVEGGIDRARLLERSYYHVVKTMEALMNNDSSSADHHRLSALNMAERIGMPSYTIWCWCGSALTAVFQEDQEKALLRYTRVMDMATRFGNPWFICQARLGLAYMYLVQDERGPGLEYLKQGFSLAARKNYLFFFFLLPKMLENLCVAALEENIESEFVRRFIMHSGLQPVHPPVHLADWPWPLKIFTLGRFSVLHHDKKNHEIELKINKPVKLLQAIIAMGGRQVAKSRLNEIFWPDADGDEQTASLKITLHRLRRMLRYKDAILQTSSHLTLNPRICWVDCWQFERLANETLAADNPSAETTLTVMQKALQLYHGPFLSPCQDEPWTFEHRKKLTELFDKLSSRSSRFSAHHCA
jgi:ATP/maltotriose-dependent transcriptional regulator MalT